MPVMQGAQVQGPHSWVSRRGVGAEAATPPEGGGVGPGPRPVSAREEERNLVPYGLHCLGKRAGERTAPDHTAPVSDEALANLGHGGMCRHAPAPALSGERSTCPAWSRHAIPAGVLQGLSPCTMTIRNSAKLTL